MTGIYAIRNKINGKHYVGQSIDIKNRWIQHRSRLRCGNHENYHLQNAYNMYSEDNFEYLVLEECDVCQLDEKEKFYIEKYNSYNDGYNQDKGGAGCIGYKHTEEEILKMRKIQNPKEVLQLDMDLNIVCQWVSCAHAGKTLGLSTRGIKSCCNRQNHQKTIGGYFWVYKEEYDNNNVDWDYYLNINISYPKRVSQYDINMNLIQVYDSVSKCAKALDMSAADVSAVCRRSRHTAHGYVFRFTDEYTDEDYLLDCNTDYTKKKTTAAKKILRYDLNGNLLNSYESIADVVRKTGFSRSSIQKCLYGKQDISHDSIWKYA